LSSQAHLTCVSTLSDSGSCPYPASCARRPAEGRPLASVSCRLSAAGIRFPGHPTLAGRLGLPCGRLTGHITVLGSHRGSHVPHARDATGVGASCISGAAVLIRPTKNPRPAPAASQRPAPTPRLIHHRRGSRITRHQRRFTRFTRPVCPLPVTPGWNRGPSAFPGASHPAVTSDARRGWGQAIEHGPETTHPASGRSPFCESTRYVRLRVAAFSSCPY